MSTRGPISNTAPCDLLCPGGRQRYAVRGGVSVRLPSKRASRGAETTLERSHPGFLLLQEGKKHAVQTWTQAVAGSQAQLLPDWVR